MDMAQKQSVRCVVRTVRRKSFCSRCTPLPVAERAIGRYPVGIGGAGESSDASHTAPRSISRDQDADSTTGNFSSSGGLQELGLLGGCRDSELTWR